VFFIVQQVFLKGCGNPLNLFYLTAVRSKLSGQPLLKDISELVIDILRKNDKSQ
jgi:hypothetical protein